MDMNKLDVMDMVIVENAYKNIINNKRNTGYIEMCNKPINTAELDENILQTEENYVNLIIELSLILHGGPSYGEYTFMDLIYTVYDDKMIVCGTYQHEHQEYIVVSCNGSTILINGFSDPEYYFKFATVINLYKELHYLN